MRSLSFVVALSVAALTPTAASAQATPAFKLSAAEIDKMVSEPVRGTAIGNLPFALNEPKVVVLRRTTSGQAEVHDADSDLFLARSGSATVLVGGQISGQRLTAAGEWRGGVIKGGARFVLGPGDVLWIPAGIPHQVIVPSGGDFRYLVLKNR